MMLSRNLHLILALLLATPLALAAQAEQGGLKELARRIAARLQDARPGWTHEAGAPHAPPGGDPPSDVAVQAWGLRDCLKAPDKVTGKEWPVSCRVTLAIYAFASPAEAQAYLRDQAARQQAAGRKPVPMELGDEGYKWKRTSVSFRRGRHLFSVGASVDPGPTALDYFAASEALAEQFAKDVAVAAAAD